MFFSIIIPVYNVEKYIDRCLDSIVTQKFSSFEVILVDDGSTDASGSRCDFYKEKYTFIKVIHQENTGSSGAKNAGMAVAEGEWILFVDSDDWIEQGMLSALYEQMQETEADIYSYNAYKTDEQGNVTDKLIYSPENQLLDIYNEKVRFQYYVNTLMQYEAGWEVWLRVFKRSIICQNKILFQSERDVFAEDYLFTFQYSLYARNIMRLCNIFYFYRQRQTSLMHTLDRSTILNRLYQWAVYAHIMIANARLTYFKKNFYYIYFMLLNYHLQYLLVQMPPEKIEMELKELCRYKKHKSWMRQIRRHKDELWKYMRVKVWL